MKAFGLTLPSLALTLSACNTICKGWWFTGCFLLLVAAGFALLAFKSKP